MLKKYIDHHLHSSFSSDSNENMEDIIIKAKQLGLPDVMFTDHVDFDSPDDIFNTNPDYYSYKNKLITLEEVHHLTLLMGVEMGYQPQARDKIDELLVNHPFDFVILSIHYVDGLDFCNGDFFKNRTPYQSYLRYYEAVLDAVTNYENYDVLGHLDFVIRYGDRKAYHYEDYKDIIDKILKIVIKKNKGLDLNTSGYRYGLDSLHPSVEILNRYKELGGSIVTLGSDAHKKEDLQANFKDAINTLKSLGFTHVTHYKDRKPTKVEL